ncbi:DUF2079 domain-containing protein [Arthrobacter sp. GMC3]|uniref:DUF2079 domain-containing protein n=1 Tax=Arthrobacter sp. GMC3 TaxID=2058894 RepID=UPI0015E2EF1D|nr:DUF2079 domain-containing protein [Arthrobacter sp. GMC3]
MSIKELKTTSTVANHTGRAPTRRPAKIVMDFVWRPFSAELRWVTVLALVAAVAYSALSIQRFIRFRSAGYDLGIFDQVVRQYSQFAPPYSQIKGPGFNIFGDHFHPIIAVLAPLYWVWDDPRMLGIAMACLLAASVFPVYLFAKPRLGRGPAFLVGAGYLFWWPVQGLVAFDFHEIAFGVPLVAWLIYALDKRSYRAVGALCVALLCVREDMGFVVMAVALIILARCHWRLGASLFALGLGGYLLITGVVIPHFNADNSFGYWQYAELGPTLMAAAAFILAHPLRTVGMLFNNETKQLLWGALLFPLGLLSLGSAYLLLAAPILLSRLLSDRPGTWSTAFQYNAILAPILVLAAVDMLGKLTRRGGRLAGLRTAAPVVFLAGVVAGTLLLPALFPLHQLFTATAWSETAHMRAQQRIVQMVPSGVVVEADDRLVPHLSNRATVGMIGRQPETATWAIVDLSQKDTGGGGDGNFTPKSALELLASKGFVEVHREDAVVLLQRPAATSSSRS